MIRLIALLLSLSITISMAPSNYTPVKCRESGCGKKCIVDDGTPIVRCYMADPIWYSCYNNSKCELMSNKSCGWTNWNKIKKCIANFTKPPKKCVETGCNKKCVEYTGQPDFKCLITLPWGYCYKHSKCSVQSNGYCGWTHYSFIEKCIKDFKKRHHH